MKSVTINGLKDISIKDLTGGEITGSGHFDELMRTVKSNMEVEFASGRITGGDYASAYVTLLQSTLQSAVQFTLQMNKVNAEVTLTNLQNIKLEKELEIMEQQRLLLISQTQLSEYQEVIQKNASTQGVIDTNALAQGQINLLGAQLTSEGAKTALTNEQEKTQEQQTLVLTEEVKIKQEATRDTFDTTRGETVAPIYAPHAMAEKALEKQNEDIGLISQKTTTEKAQTENPATYTPGAGQDGDDPKNSGLIGKQMALYAQQREGFKRDAEQKAAKLFVDTWAVKVNSTGSVGTDQSITESKLQPTDMGAVVKAMADGHGITLP